VDASTHFTTTDEASLRYEGWRIVAVCFLVATFGWAFGFYGQSVYLAELHRARGWPASLISGATTFFYLFGALAVVFVAEAVRKFGPRNCLIAGTLACAVAAISLGQVREPWQLYLANAMLALGWAGMSLGMINNTLGLWFTKKRGMAISLALNGASFGGIAGVPLLVIAIAHFGFSTAMIVAAAVMLALVIPTLLIFVGKPAAPCRQSGRDVGGLAFIDTDPHPCAARRRLPVGDDGVRGRPVRAGRLRRALDLVPRSRDRPRQCNHSDCAAHGNGSGRPRAVLDRDRPAEPAARLSAVLSQPGRGARRADQFPQRLCADRRLRRVWLLRRQSDHAAVADRAARGSMQSPSACWSPCRPRSRR